MRDPLLITLVSNGLNDGSFIARSSLRSIQILDAVRSVHDEEKERSGKALSDQDSMQAFLRSENRLVHHTLHIPQWTINAFPEEIGCYDKDNIEWKRGMFVVHFAGAWAHIPGEDATGQLMKKYGRQIV